MFNRRRLFTEPRRGRPFRRGFIKYVILSQLKDGPSHGYEIIRSLEERFHGFYTPSAGSIYPTLQMLEDMGYVISSERDGKKVYTITKEGQEFLKEQKDVVEKIKCQMKDWWGPRNHEEFHESMRELRNLGHIIGTKAHKLAPEKWAGVKEVICRTCREIEDIIEH